MLRILNVEPDQYSSDARLILNTLGELFEKNMGPDELISKIGEFDILIVRLRHQIDAKLMDSAPKLKAIVSATTGLDHIDLGYAAQKNIAVLSLRGETDFLKSIPATAELTWGLLLALTRNIPWAYASVINNEWQRDQYKGHELCGKRLGILGLGRIGEKIAAYGIAFGMHVIAYDPYRKDVPPGIVKKDSLESLMKEADVLSIHVPLNSETENIIGIKELNWLSQGAYLINTSRGAVLDEHALLNALKSGRVAGAALDVLAGEIHSSKKKTVLIEYAATHANLLITPHIGGATYESMRATEVFMANKLKNYVETHISEFV